MMTTTARTMSMTAVRSPEELRDALGGAPKRSTINGIRDRFEDVDRQWLAASPVLPPRHRRRRRQLRRLAPG
jgi:hypothetical protein